MSWNKHIVIAERTLTVTPEDRPPYEVSFKIWRKGYLQVEVNFPRGVDQAQVLKDAPEFARLLQMHWASENGDPIAPQSIAWNFRQGNLRGAYDYARGAPDVDALKSFGIAYREQHKQLVSDIVEKLSSQTRRRRTIVGSIQHTAEGDASRKLEKSFEKFLDTHCRPVWKAQYEQLLDWIKTGELKPLREPEPVKQRSSRRSAGADKGPVVLASREFPLASARGLPMTVSIVQIGSNQPRFRVVMPDGVDADSLLFSDRDLRSIARLDGVGAVDGRPVDVVENVSLLLKRGNPASAVAITNFKVPLDQMSEFSERLKEVKSEFAGASLRKLYERKETIALAIKRLTRRADEAADEGDKVRVRSLDAEIQQLRSQKSGMTEVQLFLDAESRAETHVRPDIESFLAKTCGEAWRRDAAVFVALIKQAPEAVESIEHEEEAVAAYAM